MTFFQSNSVLSKDAAGASCSHALITPEKIHWNNRFALSIEIEGRPRLQRQWEHCTNRYEYSCYVFFFFFFYLRSYCRNISVDIHPVAISKYDECVEDCATIRFTLIDDNRSGILIFVSVMRLHRSRYL